MAELLTPPSLRTRLGSRLVVGVFLGVVALADIIAGGPAFAVMVGLGVMLIFWEWAAMHRTPRRWRFAALGVLATVTLLTFFGEAPMALLLLGTAILVLLALSIMVRTAGKRWISTGLAYAGLPCVALIWMRGQPDGFHLVMWTMALVWATDIFAFFAGRSIGGPKLWPAVSPNKTWAGLLGGMSAAALFSALYGHYADWGPGWLVMLLLGAGLALVSQAGDFFESWLKRRAGVKDSGRILGRHGGIMDRVDGLVPVACLVAVWAAA
ncbi:phosphatidate cytidylyltransferase [Sandaracinobacteroides saxicola]|uniref:Phosphatidate cytidylyltransferase n=1 Tax=Sandaracinobacteroides saxicola TaxID=2759707 RepID=A0A7G5IKW2_9SPHN|nr:phosphatidate cytidylyltransferase [Sandaracinobacteroides saxicola]QMW24004.1 phosphatidate cytidylyltransferase [Sandaracinobacteroides saxicola]